MSGSRLVHIVDEVAELAAAREGREPGPVMLVALEGFLDAGNATHLLVEHLRTLDAGRVVAGFEVDELHDYRARRPPMTFHADHYADYEPPRLAVWLRHDAAGTAYLVLSGPEPDIRWEAFTRAVREVVETFAVPSVVSLGAVPMTVPHTRPVQLTNHATAQRLLVQDNLWSGDLQVPASAQALLELRLGEWDHDAMGFVAHIPHYLAQMDFPQASLVLMSGVEEATGLHWDREDLAALAEARRRSIEEQVAESGQVQEVVRGLEQQYDAYQASREGALGDEPLPSGEELGAQFEQFLAGLDRPEEE
ncbi:MAG: PAC2 family protein [Marmoricola sp.]